MGGSLFGIIYRFCFTRTSPSLCAGFLFRCSTSSAWRFELECTIVKTTATHATLLARRAQRHTHSDPLEHKKTNSTHSVGTATPRELNANWKEKVRSPAEAVVQQRDARKRHAVAVDDPTKTIQDHRQTCSVWRS